MARIGLSNNHKFLRLARALGSKHIARGVLELLWDPAFECGDPYVGTAEDLEAVADWKGPPGTLTQALLDAGGGKGAGFIELFKGPVSSTKEPQYQIHDFFHHCPEYAKARGQRERERTRPKTCAWCGETYFSTTMGSRYCGDACRQNAHRAKVNITATSGRLG